MLASFSPLAQKSPDTPGSPEGNTEGPGTASSVAPASPALMALTPMAPVTPLPSHSLPHSIPIPHIWVGHMGTQLVS